MMRKIVAGLAVSADGVVSAPHEWMVRDEEVGQLIGAMTARADAILLGRRTYVEGAGMWPNMGDEVPMASFMNNTPKYIVSTTLTEPLAWSGATLLAGELPSALAELKNRPGKEIQIPGSPTLVQSLLRDGLIDELKFLVHPVVAGGGVRLFAGISDPVRLTLVESKALRSGVLSLTYEPVKRQ